MKRQDVEQAGLGSGTMSSGNIPSRRSQVLAWAGSLAIIAACAAPTSCLAQFEERSSGPIGPSPATTDHPTVLAATAPASPTASCGPAAACRAPLRLGYRANMACDAQNLLGPYHALAAEIQDSVLPLEGQSAALPEGFVPWWDALVRQPSGLAPDAQPVAVDWLVQSALVHSSRVQAVVTEPHIRQTFLVEEDAEFDWTAFLESTFDDINEPNGNVLLTGDPNDARFKDKLWSGNGGLRRRNARGGEFEIIQRLGTQQNNSDFLLPNPQSSSRLELSYTQPLLNGAGRAYNLSRVVLARIDTRASEDEVVGELQEHLLRVTESYWDLYRSRAEFFQRMKLIHSATEILENLKGRRHVDAMERQILRAEAAVAKRRSEVARNATRVRNAESQLRLLVNDPVLIQSARLEFTPTDAPILEQLPISMSNGLSTALANRPDISQAIRDIRMASVRLGVARQDILPTLDLLVSTYVAGLESSLGFGSAYDDQFADGRPSYSMGLLFEVPLGNRAADARMQRRQWEMTRALSRFRSTVETGLTEVEVSVREVQTAYREMLDKYEAMVASDNETRFLFDRWQVMPGVDDSATLLLEDLLDSQERLADEEAEFVQAEVNHSVSLIRLRRTMGTLLRLVDQGPGIATEALGGSRVDEPGDLPQGLVPSGAVPGPAAGQLFDPPPLPGS